MTYERFDELFEKRIVALRETGKTKGIKYTVNTGDRLANFRAYCTQGLTSLMVWEVFFRKHWSAIEYFLKTGKNIGEDICDTHIHDCIMYLFLLEGLITEDTVNEITPKPRIVNISHLTPALGPAYQCTICKRTFSKLFDAEAHICPKD